MSIEDFKKIYYMEYAHRMYGRALGLFIAVPSIYIIVRRRVCLAHAVPIAMASCLVGLQAMSYADK